MHSSLPKVLHPLQGRPMIAYSIENATRLTGQKPLVVLGHAAESIRAAIGDLAEVALQEPQLGTGHALMQARPYLQGNTESVVVLPADLPLVRQETLYHLLQAHQDQAVTMLSVTSSSARGFGRLVRDALGNVSAIVEEAAATAEQLAIQELNVGIYCFRSDWLWEALEQIEMSPKGEYYLTDLIAIAYRQGHAIQTLAISDAQEAIGINNRVHLAEAEGVLRARTNAAWMLAGVTLIDPASTYIEPGVSIGQDSVILPNTHLLGKTVIGQNCILGPNTLVRDTLIGDGCKIVASVLEEAVLEEHVEIGPFGHLRKGAHLGAHVHMGNFGEVKNSHLAAGVKMGHFSYLGDATVGEGANIGAGTITCNFGLDGKKNKTEIGEGAFIGSDTLLVAPVKVGAGAATGSGAVVTRDVPEDTLVVGVPAKPIRTLETRQKKA